MTNLHFCTPSVPLVVVVFVPLPVVMQRFGSIGSRHRFQIVVGPSKLLFDSLDTPPVKKDSERRRAFAGGDVPREHSPI